MEDNLYIIRVNNSEGKQLIKLGYSSKLKERLDCYLSYNPLTEVLYTFYKENAYVFEKRFHVHHSSIYKNEWYEPEILSEMLYYIENDIINYNKNKRRQNYSGNNRPLIRPVKEHKCYKCGIVKNSSEFHKNITKVKGISGTCKECMKIININYRKR